MKIGDEVYVHGYVDEIRNGTIIIRNEGGYFGTAPDEVMPPVQPDLSGYSDKLWKAAYERGKKEAQADIVRCKDCFKREICRTTSMWAVAPSDDWFCADGERLPLPKPWRRQ